MKKPALMSLLKEEAEENSANACRKTVELNEISYAISLRLIIVISI